MRVALTGCGFWSRFQLAGWREVGVPVVAVHSRNERRVRAAAEAFGIGRAYTDLDRMIAEGGFDVLDVCSDVPGHRPAVVAAARAGLAVICQKPLADREDEVEEMAAVCRSTGVWWAVHENWRFQRPFRRIREWLDRGAVGRVYRLRLSFLQSFDVFANQPQLRSQRRFILMDLGTHLLDTARYLGGEVDSLFCLTDRVRPDIEGEDSATVLLRFASGAHGVVEMTYAGLRERDEFPSTFALIEGESGSIELGRDCELRLTTRDGTVVESARPPLYAWADPDYALVHASIVDCLRDLRDSYAQGRPAETSGEDNLRTLGLVFGCYESAETGEAVRPRRF
ncbi:MAG: Gfo/Idh/MocA family oxidoreductase [Fimbriimonadales bacterium]|nr:Gfo/Idh/MocA family oxidoreductase [Fimbriimonadales bacterium]